jgi:hypothetical protein
VTIVELKTAIGLSNVVVLALCAGLIACVNGDLSSKPLDFVSDGYNILMRVDPSKLSAQKAKLRTSGLLLGREIMAGSWPK